MTANEHLSVDQFGFVPAPHEEWIAAMQSYDGKGRKGRISPSTEIHSGQPGIFPERVQEYVDAPGKASDTGSYSPIELYHHEGKIFAGEGHHRLAAARIRGTKSIRVTHYGKQ